jgi:2-hydroxy-6-oxonona-2,4-dienedioate hydrolase
VTTDSSPTFRSLWSDLRTIPFEQKFVDAGGIRTRLAHAGKFGAPALLMLHGTAGHWEAFAPNLGAHAKFFDCYAIDMIGCGFSDKPDHPYEIPNYVAHARDFLAAVGLSKVSIIGVSLGAWVAAKFALDYPDQTDRLVLLSAAGYFSTPQNRARIQNVRTNAVDDPTWDNIQAIFTGLLAQPSSRIPDLIALRQAIYRLPNMKDTMQNILVLQNAEIRKRNLIDDNGWRSIQAPTLVIGSLADKDEYLETARVVSKLIPDVEYVEMEDVGHWPQFEDPGTFNKLSVNFLRKSVPVTIDCADATRSR